VRRVAVVVAVVASFAVGATVARAGDECRGLDVCISVPGPWVIAPTAAGATYWEMRCPRRNYIVAGLDARVTERTLGIEFLGGLGSPVNPGITTTNTVVFVATPARRSGRMASFQPLIGCVPASGGGGAPTSFGDRSPTFHRGDAVKPGKPVTRRVRTIRLRARTIGRYEHACRRGERLVGSSAAAAFARRAQPTAAMTTAVRLARRVVGRQVVVTARVGRLPNGSRPILQIHALCAR
jgi:hypothetical protein